MEPADQFYGDRHGCVRDQWGNFWRIATRVEDVSEEVVRRADAGNGGEEVMGASHAPQLGDAASTNRLDDAGTRIFRGADRVRDARSAAPPLAAAPWLTMRVPATECVASLATVRWNQRRQAAARSRTPERLETLTRSHLDNRLRTYLSFVRFSHSVFALPFALTGALLASRQQPVTWRQVCWIIVCMVTRAAPRWDSTGSSMRGSTPANPRTAARELPSGACRRLKRPSSSW